MWIEDLCKFARLLPLDARASDGDLPIVSTGLTSSDDLHAGKRDVPANAAALATLIGLTTALGLIMAPRWGTTPVALLYILPVLAAAAYLGFWYSLVAALTSPLVYNYFFIEPFHTLL